MKPLSLLSTFVSTFHGQLALLYNYLSKEILCAKKYVNTVTLVYPKFLVFLISLQSCPYFKVYSKQ